MTDPMIPRADGLTGIQAFLKATDGDKLDQLYQKLKACDAITMSVKPTDAEMQKSIIASSGPMTATEVCYPITPFPDFIAARWQW